MTMTILYLIGAQVCNILHKKFQLHFTKGVAVIFPIFAMTAKSHSPTSDAISGYLEAKYDYDYFILNCGPGL